MLFVPSIPLWSLSDTVVGSHRVGILPLWEGRHLSSSALETVRKSDHLTWLLSQGPKESRCFGLPGFGWEQMDRLSPKGSLRQGSDSSIPVMYLGAGRRDVPKPVPACCRRGAWQAVFGSCCTLRDVLCLVPGSLWGLSSPTCHLASGHGCLLSWTKTFLP